jgi:hypothetical protein
MSGDAVYDYAKLYQSFLGYDSVIFGYPERNGNRNDLVNYFLAKCSERGVVESDLRTVTLGLLMGCMWSIRADKRKVVWDWIVEKHVSEQIYTLPYQIP